MTLGSFVKVIALTPPVTPAAGVKNTSAIMFVPAGYVSGENKSRLNVTPSRPKFVVWLGFEFSAAPTATESTPAAARTNRNTAGS